MRRALALHGERQWLSGRLYASAMERWITVWVEHLAAPAEVTERWVELPDLLAAEDLRVRGWSDGSAVATLQVHAASEQAAVAAVRERLQSVFGSQSVDGLEARTVPRVDDEVPIEDEDADDEPGLLWRRAACEWTEYSATDDSRVIEVHYVQAGTAGGPGAAIAEVVVSEAGSTVSISLFEREVTGVYPDGAYAARALAAVGGCLGVRLRSPLSQRRVIDGTTGLLARRLDPTSSGDRRKLDWAAQRGCPIWEP